MADILSRGDIIDSVAAQVDMPQKKVDDVIKAFEDAIRRQLTLGGEIRIAGFGTFKVTQRSERMSRNPRTGEPVPVPARSAPSFKAGKALKEAAAASATPAAPAKKAPAKSKAAPKAEAAPAETAAPAKAVKAPAKAAKTPAKAPAKAKKK